MAEPTKNQTGGGSDNYGQAAKQLTKAAEQIGKSTAKNAAAKGAEATGRAAAATVKGAAKTGKAVQQIAAGTAAGGPWGAIISAAWSMRHTLYKILVCVSLVIVFIVIIVTSLPSIILSNIKGSIFGSSGDPAAGNSLVASYSDLSDSVYKTIEKGYRSALEEADRIIAAGGYDYALSVSALEDQAAGTMNYDVCYILAAYSASVQRNNPSKENMVYKLERVKADMFPVTYEERSTERPKEDHPSETETVKYAACVIHAFDEDVILTAFGIDINAKYGSYNLTYGEFIEYTSNALKMTLYGTTENKSR